jgi:hypothetical protein
VSSADLWHPLRGLGPEASVEVDRALGSRPIAEVEALLDVIERRGDRGATASLLAARFSLAQRAGEGGPRVDALAAQAAAAFRAAGDERAASFLEVERAAVLAADKTALDGAARLLDALVVPTSDPALAAAILRVRGAVQRSRADLRGSLLHLERARELAEASGNVREIIRAQNTLGTSYAALGVAALARDALERARELAELEGHRQSASIAAGQLAVLALDAGRPSLAIRHLELQRSLCERLGDAHGLARSLSLLVEANYEAHDVARARAYAEQSRDLYARSPWPWARLQAVMATIYEAEGALAAGDDARAQELLRSCDPERHSDAPALRVARARGSFVQVWALLRGAPLRGDRALENALGAAFASLRHSPRPTWVERLLLLGVEVAQAHGRPDLVPALAVRAASLIELRGAASSGALTMLRQLAPEEAVSRAMILGRDLVLRARLALAPLGPFEAALVEIETDGDPASVDRALACFSPAGEPADGLLATVDGNLRVRLAIPPTSFSPATLEAARAAAGVRAVSHEGSRVQVDVPGGPSLRPA